jgi:hypothetical protein
MSSFSLSSCTIFCCFTIDDKCGSHWQFLPMPTNMRDRKDTASRWSYRQGAGNFLSIVPPMLQVGANFGCTGFVVTLYHLIEHMKLAPTVEVIFRQTDRGPDNNTAITHQPPHQDGQPALGAALRHLHDRGGGSSG